MKLTKYAYKLVDRSGFDDWIMDEIDLQDFNLMVGKNATGKSRAMIVLTAFAGMITQTSPVYLGNWEFTFSTDNGTIYYNIKRFAKEIRERILADDKLVLERNNEITKLYSETKQAFDEIHPPDNKLVLHVRRDKKEYPFLENIVEWAEKTHIFMFGQIHPDSFIGSDSIKRKRKIIEDIPALIDKLSDASKNKITDEFNELGYDIDNFFYKKRRRRGYFIH
ncbi:MAG: hypothetical protein GY749_15600 [Desulfobacteraceae bacterium]|nr:hypothetical protein [Desulfobacteraceae bacterium]